jgi:hypothetical protein
VKRLLLTCAALLSLAAPANADATATYRYENGDVVSTSCYRGAYGYQCRTWTNGSGNSPQIVNVPADYTPNTNPNWGRGCRSCDGAAK